MPRIFEAPIFIDRADAAEFRSATGESRRPATICAKNSSFAARRTGKASR
jgi:hypothetical protein